VSVVDATDLDNPVVSDLLTIDNPDYVTDIARSPDGRYLYVTTSNYVNKSGAVSIIDTTTNTVVGSAIPVDGMAQGLAVSADGSQIYVSSPTDFNESTGHLSVISASKTANALPIVTVQQVGQPDASGTITYHVIGSDTDGDTLSFAPSLSAHGTLTDLGNGMFIYRPDSPYFATAPGGATDLVFTAYDGHGGFKSSEPAYTFTPKQGVVDTISIASVGAYPSNTVVTDDGIAFISTTDYDDGQTSVAVVNLNTGHVESIPIQGSSSSQVELSADQSRAFVYTAVYDQATGQTTALLHVIDTQTRETFSIPIPSGFERVISPDGPHA
jgi:YVTN family beta-propeller protein